MRIFEGPADAADAARVYFIRNGDAWPEHMRAQVEPYTKSGMSPLDLMVRFTESVYANRDQVDQEAVEIAAGLAGFIDERGYHGRLNGRATAMTAALRRDSGETAPAGRKWPAASTDPDPAPEYGPPPVNDEPAEGDPAADPA